LTAFEDGLWRRLVEDHGAERVVVAHAAPRRRTERPLLIGGGVTALAGVGAGLALALGAFASAPPAYALTRNAAGSITITINDLETAAPQLNARFAAMGIEETVVPVQANCPVKAGSPDLQGAPLLVDPQEQRSDTLTFYPGDRWLAPGFTGIIAAEQLPDGKVAMAIEAIRPPVPSCFPATAYRIQRAGTAKNGIPIFQVVRAS
jgi:hypothetical protein